MGTLLKPLSVGLSRLTNGKYSAFMNHVLDLSANIKTEDQTLTAGLAVFKDKVGIMTDAYNQARTFVETQDLTELNQVRMSAFKRLAVLLEFFRYSKVAAEQEAYHALKVALSPYEKVMYLPIEEVSAALLGVVMDFSKAENAAYVTALKLGDFVKELDTANRAFIAKYVVRQKSRENKLSNNADTIRPELNSIYEDLVDRIFAMNTLASTSEAVDFIKALNNYIVEMKINMNVSAGLRAAAKKRKAEKDKADGKTDGGATTGGTTDGTSGTTGGTTGGSTDTGSGSTTEGKADEGTTGGTTDGNTTDSGTTTGGNTDTGGTTTGDSSGGTGKEDLPVGDA